MAPAPSGRRRPAVAEPPASRPAPPLGRRRRGPPRVDLRLVPQRQHLAAAHARLARRPWCRSTTRTSGHHLGVWRPISLAWATAEHPPDLTTLDRVKHDKDSYFFCDRYRDAWEPALRQLIVDRFDAQVADTAAVAEPLVVVKEPGSHVADVLLSMFPGVTPGVPAARRARRRRLVAGRLPRRVVGARRGRVPGHRRRARGARALAVGGVGVPHRGRAAGLRGPPAPTGG